MLVLHVDDSFPGDDGLHVDDSFPGDDGLHVDDDYDNDWNDDDKDNGDTYADTVDGSRNMKVRQTIICSFIFPTLTGGGANYANVFEGSATQPGDYAVSILSGMFLFGGW